MKKFGIKLLIFILPILIFLVFMEYNLGKMENSYTYKRSQIEKIIKEVEVINFGSSHGLYAINPDNFDFQGFNMANTSQSFYYDYSLALKYVKDASNLKVVLIPISYFSFGFSIADNPETFRSGFYERVYDIPVENNVKINILNKYSYMAVYGQIRSMWFLFKNFKVNLVEHIQTTGVYMENDFNIQAYMDNISNDKGKKRVNFHNIFEMRRRLSQ